MNAIFVMGQNRSGTKWLSNLIANHPDVVAVQDERFAGILETNMFDALRRKFGDLGPPDEYAALVELWSQTEFFKLAGGDKELFYRLDPRPLDHFELFRILMDDLAARSGRQTWLQKTDPWNAFELLFRFPGARFVVIERNSMDLLRSTYFMDKQQTGPFPSRVVIGHVLQSKILRQVLRRQGIVHVRYEDLRARPEQEMRRVCSELGLAFAPALLEVPFQTNPSFYNEPGRRSDLSSLDRWKIRVVRAATGLVPSFLLAAARRGFRSRHAYLVGGSFRTAKDTYGLR